MGQARLDVKAVEQPAEVSYEQQPVFDGDGAARAVHRLLERELAVAVGVMAGIVPDRSRVGIGPSHFSLFFDHRLNPAVRQRGFRILKTNGQFRAGVAPLGWVDAPEVADSLAMLRIFADSNVDQSLMKHRSANDVIAIRPASERVFRLLGVAVKLPEQLGAAGPVASGIKAVDPAVAPTKKDLRNPVNLGKAGTRPLPVQHIGSGRSVCPEHLAIPLVNAEKAWSIGVWEVDMPLVYTVAGVDEQQIAGCRDAARAHVVLRDAQLFHHVEYPDDVSLVFVGDRLVREGAVIFTVVKALGVETLHLASAGDVPEPVALDQRGAADALERPVMNPTGRQLFAGVLPEE